MADIPSTETSSAVDEATESVARNQAIIDALHGLRFGSVTVIVQDGVVVQVERLEKKRLGRAAKTK